MAHEMDFSYDRGGGMISTKLNALFAEKVLGWRDVRTLQGGNVYFGEPLCTDGTYIRDKPSIETDTVPSHYSRVPEFTTSLDAAWAGVEKVGAVAVKISNGRDNNKLCELSFRLTHPRHRLSPPTLGSTPALALVKACLLAVGVGQKEMEENE